MKKITLILIIFFLTACSTDYKELNEIAIVEAIGIEKQDGKILVTAQVININALKQNTSTEESKIYVYTGLGNTIFEAMRSMSNESPKRLYYPHTKIIILDHTLFENIDQFVDVIVRDTESMINQNIVTTTNDSPSDILKTITPLSSSSAEDIENILKISEKNTGTSYNIRLEDFLKGLVSYGTAPILTNISLNDNIKNKDNESVLKNSNISYLIQTNNLVFYKDDGSYVQLSKDESLGYNFIKNNISYPLINLNCGNDKNFSMEVFSSNTSLKENLKKNEIVIDSKITLTIGEFDCDMDITSNSTYNYIKTVSENKIKEIVESTIDLALKERTDFIGIGNFIYKNNPTYFDFKNKNWNKEGLNNIKSNVKVDVRVIKQGNLKEKITRK